MARSRSKELAPPWSRKRFTSMQVVFMQVSDNLVHGSALGLVVRSDGASGHNEWHAISRLASTAAYLAVEGEDAVAALGLEDVGRAAEDAHVGVVEESAAVCGQEHLCERRRRRRRGRGRVRIRG